MYLRKYLNLYSLEAFIGDYALENIGTEILEAKQDAKKITIEKL